MWYQETVFYQICPLGLCGAPEVNDDIQAHRILKNQGLCPLSTRIRNRCCVFQSCIQQ